MLLWISAGAWFLCGFVLGLVTGIPELRTFGLAGTLLFGVLVWVTDVLARRRTARSQRGLLLERDHSDLFGDVECEPWPHEREAA